MKIKVLLISTLLLWYISVYAQYYDKKIELPMAIEYNELVGNVNKPIITYSGYILPYSVEANIPRRAVSHLGSNGNVYLYKISKEGSHTETKVIFPKDTTQTRWLFSIEQSGKYFVGIGSYRKIIGAWAIYDERGLFFKTDTLGNLLWYRTVGDSLNNAATTKFFQGGFVHNANCYVGYGVGKGNSVTSNYYGYIHAVDSMGNTLWEKKYWDYYYSHLYSGIKSYTGNMYFTGYHMSTPPPWDASDSAVVWLLKTDSYGNKLHEKAIRIPGVITPGGWNVIESRDKKHLFLCIADGNRYENISRMVLAKTDTLGNLIWYKVTPAHNGTYCSWATIVHQVYELPDKSILALVRNNDPRQAGCVVCNKRTPVLWLYKLDSLGNTVWKRRWYRSTLENQRNIQIQAHMLVENDKDIFINWADSDTTCCPSVWSSNFVMDEPHYVRTNCAGFTGLPNVQVYNQNVTAGVHTLYAKVWNTDSLIIEWGDGTRQRFNMIDTVYRDTVFKHTYSGYGVYLHPKIRAYACGYMYESDKLQEGEEYVHIRPSELPLKSMSIYPNPSEEYVWLNLEGYKGEALLCEIVNMQGQAVQEHNISQEVTRLNVSALPQGVYFVKVNGYNVQKLVKQ